MEDSLFDGYWRRFSEYEISDGYVRPARGADGEKYSPLDDFQLARSQRGEKRAPYETLLRVIEQLRFDTQGRLAKESAGLLLQWCTRNGLLGLLLHQVQEARFAPHWARPIEHTPSSEDKEAMRDLRERMLQSEDPALKKAAEWLRTSPRSQRVLYYTQRSYRRTNWGSFLFGDTQELAGTRQSDVRLEGKLVSKSVWPRSTASVLVQHLSTGEWEWQSVDRSWGEFFPDVALKDRATYQYPKPHSEEFWQGYGEPLHQFIGAARVFQRAFQSAVQFKSPDKFERGNDRIMPSTSNLNALIPPVGPALLRMPDGSFEQRQVSPSLLGALVIMAQQDLASERRVIRCRNDRCASIVVAVGYQTAYCSDQCRFRAEQRAYRARKARDQKRQGRRSRKSV